MLSLTPPLPQSAHSPDAVASFGSTIGAASDRNEICARGRGPLAIVQRWLPSATGRDWLYETGELAVRIRAFSCEATLLTLSAT